MSAVEPSSAAAAANPPVTPAAHAAARTLDDLPGPKGVPVLGNMLQIESIRFHHILEDWSRQFGTYYTLRMGRRRVLVVADQPVIAGLLRDRPESMRRSSRTSITLEELGTHGVFTSEGEEWRKQRKLVMRGLTPEVIRNFFPTLAAMTERLRLRWQAAAVAGRPIDLLRDLKSFALDVTVSLAMGQDINTLEHDDNPLQRDIEAIFNRVARRLTSPFPYWRYVKLAPDRAAEDSSKRIAETVGGFIAATRKQLDAHPELRSRPANMLQALIVARDEPGSGFTDEHVIGNAVTMVFAGEDTTSNSVGWLLNFLAHHPQAEQQIRAEADALLGQHSVLQDFSLLDRFDYLEAATSEAMRLKPVAPFMAMETNVDMVIGDVQVPKQTLVMSLLRRSGEEATGFDQPELFRPERWLEKHQAGQGDPARKLFPFGGGPRFCPGRYLAMAEIKMITSMIARNFTLERDTSAPPVEELFTFTMTPSALPVRLRKRKAG